jgi:inward rectifier potassium channel
MVLPATASSFTPWRDVYHFLLRASWATLFAVLFVGYVSVNTVFAALYLLGGDCIGAADPQSFLLAFSFSVQTISTIGYGAMSPTTPYANIIVAIEVFCGLLGVGLATGIIFTKFARPTPRVRFSQSAVIGRRPVVLALLGLQNIKA